MSRRDKIYFLSDLHLGSRYFSDTGDAERRAVAFLEMIRHDAAEVYLLGDVLDYWFEYRHVVPRGYIRFFGKLAELTDSGIKVTWLKGNHDMWISDYLPHELGVEVAAGILIREFAGRRFFLEHGDGVGWQPRSYRVLRYLFRNSVCRKLLASVHPRWTVPLAYGWSHSNRGHHPEAAPYGGADKEPLMRFAREYMSEHTDIDYFIFGHRHILVEQQVEAPGCYGETLRATVVILGEWMTLCSYAVFDGTSLTLRRFSL